MNPVTGVYEFYKADGTGTSEPSYGIPSQGGDFVDIGNTDPKFIGGFGNNINYKQFSLYFLFQFKSGIGRNYLYSIYNQQYSPGGLTNEPTAILDHWKKPGDISAIGKVTAGYGPAAIGDYSFAESSATLSDASYIRLKTVALSYSPSAHFLKKINASNCKFYINAQNLLLLTRFKVGDPELANIFSFPIQKTIVVGLSINF
ncbi:MAG: hypothetical protein M3Z26_06280 [Bacteroidota bacterium]|nr:hypothetical protein [Bacteroidota bacterium]